MTQTTTARHTEQSEALQFGAFERAHLLERLSVLYMDSASLRPLTSSERPLDKQAAYRMALTADARLAAYGYRLDEQSLIALAELYHAGTFCDPTAVVATWLSAPSAQPMYPDFPTQVMSMDESTYRFHQAMHYFSTYGIEQIAADFGISGEVTQGWLPDVTSTEKAKGDGALLKTRALTLVFTADEAAEAVWQHLLYRNERMTDSDVCLAASLPVPADADGSRIVFHENALTLLTYLITHAKGRSVEDFVQRARCFAAHPGDVIKFVIHLRGQVGVHGHFPTSWRRRLVMLFESYPARAFEENLTLNRERSLRVLELISYNRFSRSAEHRAAVDALRDDTLRSWASRKEEAYRSADTEAIVHVLSERPGVMLREVVRMLRVGVPGEAIEATLSEAKLSFATLLNTTAKLGSPYDPTKHARPKDQQVILAGLDSEFWSTGTLTAPEDEDVTRERQIRCQAVQIMRSVLRTKLRTLNTPLRGKRVLLDAQDYDLAHSYVLTNVAKGVSSYFAPGMAMSIPKNARRVRFFTFWDDRGKRVDLDLHGETDTGTHVGWNGRFNQAGLTMSGDITHSKNAAEYLDVELAKAAEAGVSFVKLTLHYFNGGTFSQVATAFTGLLVVDHVTPDYQLYQSENVLMRNDLTEVQENSLGLCLIDVANRCVVPLMGGDVPYNSSFTAQEFLGDLLASQDATLVGSEDELGDDGVRLTVGKSAEGGLSLIDNGWFVLE